VVESDEWKWYVEGEYYRELRFVHLRHPAKWRVGAFDLYRPDRDSDVIVDFKTHDISAERAERTALRYRLQAAVYRAAARALAGKEASVRFHFTGPGVVVGG
jgi:ATP-dependent exoDNAse (exonuclease V) beta subunit